MSNRERRWQSGESLASATVDEGNADAEVQHVRNYVWDTNTLAWVRMTPASGGGGGGGAATIADGADTAQGTTTDTAWSGTGSGTIVGILKAIYAKVAGTLTITGAVTGPLTDTQLRASNVPVSFSAPTVNQGTAGAAAWKTDGSGVIQPVSGTFWQGTQPVSGTFWQGTQPVSGTFWQATQPVSLAAQIAARMATGAIDLAGTALTPKFAKITASSSGDTTIVSAVAGKKIRVLRWDLVASAAVNAKWRSSTTGDITGLYYFGANGGISAPEASLGHFETVASEGLVINLATAVAVGGSLTYVEV